MRVERDVADLVADQQRDPLEAVELLVELVLALRVGEEGDPFGRGAEQDALPGEARADPQGDRDVRLAGAGRAEQDHVLFGVQEVELAEVLDHLLLHRALEGEVELLQRLVRREPGGADPQPAAGGLARGHLGREQRLGEPLIAPLLLAGALGERSAAPGPRPALSSPGTGARARRAWSCDQLVIDRQRPLLDQQLVTRLPVAGAERPGVLERGDGPVLREHALVPAGELAGVQRDRDDLPLGDADLDAPADQVRVQRVVVGVERGRAGRAAPGPPSDDPGPAPARAAAASPPAPRSAGRSAARAASCASGAFAFSNQSSSCSWKSRWFANRRPGSKFVSMYPCNRSTHPFACGSAGSQNSQPTGSCPQNAA